jgi:hypothetical protein
VFVLINQYSTRLLVSYVTHGKTQLYENTIYVIIQNKFEIGSKTHQINFHSVLVGRIFPSPVIRRSVVGSVRTFRTDDDQYDDGDDGEKTGNAEDDPQNRNDPVRVGPLGRVPGCLGVHLGQRHKTFFFVSYKRTQ